MKKSNWAKLPKPKAAALQLPQIPENENSEPTTTKKRSRSIRNADATNSAIEPCDEAPLKKPTRTASPAHHFGKGEVFVGSSLDECDRDTCEAVLHLEGFTLSSNLVISKKHDNVLIVTTEADSSSSSGFKVTKTTNKLWSCLAIGGMIISHTWIHAYVWSHCLNFFPMLSLHTFADALQLAPLLALRITWCILAAKATLCWKDGRCCCDF
jgi:hypothetical protein